jgi:hypothetical protein
MKELSYTFKQKFLLLNKYMFAPAIATFLGLFKLSSD